MRRAMLRSYGEAPALATDLGYSSAFTTWSLTVCETALVEPRKRTWWMVRKR